MLENRWFWRGGRGWRFNPKVASTKTAQITFCVNLWTYCSVTLCDDPISDIGTLSIYSDSFFWGGLAESGIDCTKKSHCHDFSRCRHTEPSAETVVSVEMRADWTETVRTPEQQRSGWSRFKIVSNEEAMRNRRKWTMMQSTKSGTMMSIWHWGIKTCVGVQDQFQYFWYNYNHNCRCFFTHESKFKLHL